MTLAPSRASTWTVARPMPEPPPVTIATLPSSLPIYSALSISRAKVLPTAVKASSNCMVSLSSMISP